MDRMKGASTEWDGNGGGYIHRSAASTGGGGRCGALIWRIEENSLVALDWLGPQIYS